MKKADSTARQAGQFVESVVDTYVVVKGRPRGGRGFVLPVLGLLGVAGGVGAIAFANSDEAQREQAGKKVSELANTVLDRIGELSG